MSDPAATLALCSWLKKQVAAWEAEAKSALELETGERKAGKVNGQVVSYTNKVKGRKTVKVTNEAMLLEYVRQYAATEVIVVEQINPAYRTKLLDYVLKEGGRLEGDDGVYWEDVVEVVEGEPYLTTKLTEDAPIVIAGLLAAGRIGIDGLKALEAS
jgi:hypothetical protein